MSNGSLAGKREPIERVRARLEALVRANAAPRCGARSKRTGKPCRAAAMPNGRCRIHGGKSTGPLTPEGLERSRRANWKHGYYSREAKAERSRVRAAMLALRRAGARGSSLIFDHPPAVAKMVWFQGVYDRRRAARPELGSDDVGCADTPPGHPAYGGMRVQVWLRAWTRPQDVCRTRSRHSQKRQPRKQPRSASLT
jgi:hypothetical protein